MVVLLTLVHSGKVQPPNLSQTGLTKFDALKREFGKNIPWIGGTALVFVAGYFGITYVAQKLLRRFALPRIVDSLRNPAKAQFAAVQKRVEDPAVAAGTTYAPVWRRGVALVIDLLINVLILGFLAGSALNANGDFLFASALVGWAVSVCAYHVWTQARMQRSLGMRVARIYLVGAN